MNRIALMMLFGRRGTFVAMVFGMSFAVLLMAQQMAIFLGVLHRTTGPLQNIGSADVWVASAHTEEVNVTCGRSRAIVPVCHIAARVAARFLGRTDDRHSRLFRQPSRQPESCCGPMSYTHSAHCAAA